MNEEILNAIKKDYNDRKNKKDRTIKIKKRILELEKHKVVKEYLMLLDELNELDDSILNEKENSVISTILYRYIRKIDETNGIYIYLGTYKNSCFCDIEHGSGVDRVNRYDSKAEFCIYRDLEQADCVEIPINDCDEFENTHRIIYPNTFLEESYYYRLQVEFIRDAMEYGQEEAVAKVLKKCSK